MSVIIKGMEMPQRCMDCGVDTGLCGLWNGYAERYSRRHPKCPLIEIPTPHGRLVDLDKMVDEYWDGSSMRIGKTDIKDIEEYDVVIEAEGREE